ncbi:MAG: SlyX family protein [Pseudomonadota bacterium]
MNKNSDELVDLQSRVAFQENTLNQLDAVVVTQQKQIDKLERAVAVLAQRLGSLEQTSGLVDGADDQPPPHY